MATARMKYPSYVKDKKSKSSPRSATWALVIALILVAFGCALWVMSRALGKVDEVIGQAAEGLSKTQASFAMRTVSVTNKFTHSVAVYYEDGMSGSFLANLSPLETTQISAATGHVIYATEQTGWARIAAFSVRSGADAYSLSPPSSDAQDTHYSKATYELSTEVRQRPHPQIKLMHEGRTTAMAAKFRSMSPKRIDMFYEDGKGGTPQGHLKLGQETTTNTYEGHVFYFCEAGNRNRELARFTMSKDQVLYVVYDPLYPAPEDLLKRTKDEEKFMVDYFNRTGIHWRHYYGPEGPRPPPKLYMWPAEQVGQVHRVISPEGFWVCDGAAHDCKSKEPTSMELEVVSLKPRVLLIPRFLSDYEADVIVKLARPKMASSSVGDVEAGVFSSDTRTSRNSWVARRESAVTESLFLRAAHLLNIDEKLLKREANAEDIQVVHYVNGQKYDSHHDWGVSGFADSRYITLLLYLTDQAGPSAGGETAFPKANGGTGIKVTPKKGSAVLFYNLLEDGNGDDLALHAALPVHKGEKWLANFWVWDGPRGFRR